MYSVSSTNKTDRHDITEILLKMALNTINLNLNQTYISFRIRKKSSMSSMGVYYTLPGDIWFRIMVFNAIFNNISVILWWSVLLVEETGENH